MNSVRAITVSRNRNEFIYPGRLFHSLTRGNRVTARCISRGKGPAVGVECGPGNSFRTIRNVASPSKEMFNGVNRSRHFSSGMCGGISNGGSGHVFVGTMSCFGVWWGGAHYRGGSEEGVRDKSCFCRLSPGELDGSHGIFALQFFAWADLKTSFFNSGTLWWPSGGQLVSLLSNYGDHARYLTLYSYVVEKDIITCRQLYRGRYAIYYTDLLPTSRPFTITPSMKTRRHGFFTSRVALTQVGRELRLTILGLFTTR